LIKNKAQPLKKLRLLLRVIQQRKTSWSDKLLGPSQRLLRVKSSSRESSAHRLPVEAKEIVEAVAVEVMASVAEAVNVAVAVRDAKAMVNTEVAIVPVESAVDAVKDVVVDVAVIDPELPSLKVRQVLLLNALKEEAKEKDLKANHVKMLTPWIVRMVPDVDIAVTAKVELLVRAPGVMKRNLSFKMKLLLLNNLNLPPSKENANQESPVRDVRDPLKKKRNRNPL